MANWLDLHQDLLVRISDFCIISDIGISPDYIRMQSVCRSWRSVLKKKMHNQLPWLMMLPNNKEEEGEDPDTRVFFSLSQQKIHTIPLPEMRGKRCCGSFHNGWLMFVDLKLDICLFHPWSRKKIHLPPQSTFKKPNFVNDEVDDQVDDEGGDYSYTMEEIRDSEILKAALSDDGKMVVVLYGLGHLGFCRIGEDDSYADVESDSMMEDVRYHRVHFYALSQRGSLYLLHIEDGSHPRAEKLTVDYPLPYVFVAHLVPDIVTDTMFVITRDGFGHKTIHFDIFRVSFEEGADEKKLKKFTKIESLGDWVLFLGYNSPMIIMASQFPGFKGNRIYFTDSIMENYILCSKNSNGCRDLGVFSVEDGNVEQLFADRFHPIFSPPIWIAPPYLFILGRFWRREAIIQRRTTA